MTRITPSSSNLFKLYGFLYLCFLLLSSSAQAREENKGEKLWIDGEETTAPITLKLPSFAPVIEKLGTSVVNISISGTETGLTAEQELLNQLFQVPGQGQKENKRPFRSLGSGFVISESGLIVTNNHVVEKADKIMVTFKDDRKNYSAKVIGRDAKTDLALIKVDAGKKLKPVVFGKSHELRPGDWVIAIGNPFRLGHTATVGIVSALGRKMPGGGPYDDFIQTDASINPGNSGGPLFNSRGEVVGVNTAIYSPGRVAGGGFNIGIGFATPIGLVKDIISQLHADGKVTRGWLGVLIQSITPDLADALGLEDSKGALVAEVMEDSPAAAGGIKRRDVIVGFDGKEVMENDQLPLMVAQTKVGSVVAVDIIRNGSKETLDITIEKLKDDKSPEKKEEPVKNTTGAIVQDLTPDIAKSLGLTKAMGVVVTGVQTGSAAEKAGLTRGDVIVEVAGKEIKDSDEFYKATKSFKKGDLLLFLVQRNGGTVFMTLKDEE